MSKILFVWCLVNEICLYKPGEDVSSTWHCGAFPGGRRDSLRCRLWKHDLVGGPLKVGLGPGIDKMPTSTILHVILFV